MILFCRASLGFRLSAAGCRAGVHYIKTVEERDWPEVSKLFLVDVSVIISDISVF